jgi:hypothetical protein
VFATVHVAGSKNDLAPWVRLPDARPAGDSAGELLLAAADGTGGVTADIVRNMFAADEVLLSVGVFSVPGPQPIAFAEYRPAGAA